MKRRNASIFASSPSAASAFSVLESLGFLAALAVILAFSYPKVASIWKEDTDATKFHGLCLLEAAKMQYDQDARPDDKKVFDESDDATRFAMLQHLLNPNDPAAFAKSYKLTNIRINGLGENVQVD